MRRLSDASTPPGIVAVVRTGDLSRPPTPRGPVLVLDAVSDPGNVGTLIRTATAFGAQVVSIGGADPFGPKAVRASAGTCYRARIHRIDDVVALDGLLRGDDRPIVGLAADGPRTLAEVASGRPPQGIVLVVGSEPHGLSSVARGAVDTLVRIPMAPDVESFNVAAAGAIAMHALMGA
jgi:TrmH family RNA methyltransferase